MSEAKHTPGPWKLLKRGSIPVVREITRPNGESPHYRADVVAPGALGIPAQPRHVVGLDFGYGSKLNECDALLIAAAPELLEALKMWQRFAAECEQRKITVPLWASMLNETAVELTEAAIAKAEGQEP